SEEGGFHRKSLSTWLGKMRRKRRSHEIASADSARALSTSAPPSSGTSRSNPAALNPSVQVAGRATCRMAILCASRGGASMQFQDLGLSQKSLAALDHAGFEAPTPVQA